MAHKTPRLLAATLCGAASALAMAPLSWIAVLFITLSLLYALLAHAHSKWQAFLTGWLFGFGYHLAGLYWIANALLVEGNPYSWAWPLAAIGLPAVLALYYGIATVVAWRVSNPGTMPGFFIFGLTLFAAEYLRGHMLTGFPWNLFGYGWGGFWPLAQSVELIGIYGLTLLTIMWCTLPGYVLLAQSSRLSKSIISSIAAISFGIGWSYGAIQLDKDAQFGKAGQEAHFVVIQPNIAQHKKWRQDHLRENFRRHIAPSYYKNKDQKSRQISSKDTTFIVWPETALAYFHLQDREIRSQIRDMLASYPGETYLISGALLQLKAETDQARYANAVIIMNNQGEVVHSYKKSHLVPFGEYIPFKDWIPLQPVAAFDNLVAGTGPGPIRINQSHTILPLICYEVIFPELARTKNGNNSQANWLVNVTNDAWYGHSSGPYQHLMQSRFRAIETGKPLVRAANTGISAIIDSRGRPLVKTPIFVSEKLYLNTKQL